MNARDAARIVRRERLQARSAQLREALCADCAGLVPALRCADGGLGALRFLQRHRGLLAIGFAAFWLLRPKAALRWTRRGVLAWGICRRAAAAMQGALANWRAAGGSFKVRPR